MNIETSTILNEIEDAAAHEKRYQYLPDEGDRLIRITAEDRSIGIWLRGSWHETFYEGEGHTLSALEVKVIAEIMQELYWKGIPAA